MFGAGVGHGRGRAGMAGMAKTARHITDLHLFALSLSDPRDTLYIIRHEGDEPVEVEGGHADRHEFFLRAWGRAASSKYPRWVIPRIASLLRPLSAAPSRVRLSLLPLFPALHFITTAAAGNASMFPAATVLATLNSCDACLLQ